MKKLLFGLMALSSFFFMSSFTTIENSANGGTHPCKYRVYNVRTGETIGYVNISDVPDNVPCDSKVAKDAALASWYANN